MAWRILNGQQAVWQVREIAPPSVSAARSETGTAALLYQVEGSSIIRNDVTGKRALLDPASVFPGRGGRVHDHVGRFRLQALAVRRRCHQ